MGDSKNIKGKYKPTGFIENAFDFVEVFVYAFVVVLIILTFFVRHSPVSGRSMVPTLHDKDVLIIDEFAYGKVKTGDIIVCQTPGVGYDEPLVKRVIATGGQTLSINHETWEVYVDGKKLNEDYIEVKNCNMTSAGVMNDYEFPIVIPEGKVFVMGDNRTDSLDSRYRDIVGFVDERAVIGKVVFRILPFNNFGSVYSK